MKNGITTSLTFAAVMLAAVTVCAATACSAPTKSEINRPPVIEQFRGSTTWAPEWEGDFTVIAKDPDGDKLTYTWLADNGSLTPDGNTATWISPNKMGKYNITVVINDGNGHEVRGVKEVNVFLNADGSQNPEPPVVLKMTLPSTDVATGSKRIRIWFSTPVECQVSGATDRKDLKYTWTASGGKIQGKGLEEGTASAVTWIAPGVAGNYTLDVVVSDSQGNQSKGTASFTVFCCGN